MYISVIPNISPLWLSSNQKIYQSITGCTQDYYRASSQRTNHVLSQLENSYFDRYKIFQLRISYGSSSMNLFSNKHPHTYNCVTTLILMECNILIFWACVICTSLLSHSISYLKKLLIGSLFRDQSFFEVYSMIAIIWATKPHSYVWSKDFI